MLRRMKLITAANTIKVLDNAAATTRPLSVGERFYLYTTMIEFWIKREMPSEDN